jgi:hypothetical protein
MTERPDNDITLIHGCHAPGCEFELVIACLVIQHTHGNQHTFFAGNVPGQPQFVSQLAVLRD